MFLYRITKTNPAADPCFFSYSMFISSLVALHLFDEMPHQTDSSNPLQWDTKQNPYSVTSITITLFALQLSNQTPW
jgi:hypothetical protein